MFASAEDKFIVSTNVNFFLDFFISVLYLLDLKGKKKRCMVSCNYLVVLTVFNKYNSILLIWLF